MGGGEEKKYGPHLPKPRRAWGPTVSLSISRWYGVLWPKPHRAQAKGRGGWCGPLLLKFPSPPMHALLLDLVGSIHRFCALATGNMWNLIVNKSTDDCSSAPRSSDYPECNLISILLMRTHRTYGQLSRFVSSSQTLLGALLWRSKRKVCEKSCGRLLIHRVV